MIYTPQQLKEIVLPMLDTLTVPDAGPKQVEALADSLVKMFEQDRKASRQGWYDRFEASAPKQLTEADNLDFNLHDDDPKGNCYYAYNCAIDDMKRAVKKAVGLS